jgi:MFS family permease
LKLREIGQIEREARFDMGGIITFPLAISCVLGGFTLTVLGRWAEPLTNLLFGGGALLLVLFWAIEKRVKDPMMDLALFKIRIFWAGNATFFLTALSRGASTFILSWYFQAGLMLEPRDAAVRMLPLALSMAVSAPFFGRLSDKAGSKLLSTLGLAISGLGLFLLSALMAAPDASYVFMAVMFVMLGVGNAMFNAPNTNSVLSSVPPNRRGVAAGTRNLLLATGQTISIALAMAIISTTMSYQSLAKLFSGDEGSAAGLDVAAFFSGLRLVFLVCGCFSVVGVVISMLRGTAAGRQTYGRETAGALAEA